MDGSFDFSEYGNRDMMRLTTAGSVDDGKSTLIGRMLYDSKAIFQDQMEALKQSARLRGEETVNLALLTDGLRSEREQGITIDVAYHYFSTPKRKFIIADTPGHEQYTRNMITGASTAHLAIILIDARNGVMPQSKRHGIIAGLLGIPHIIVAVNKMDAVNWSEKTYQKIVSEYTEFSAKLDIHDVTFIPISALLGDNVVKKSNTMSWYDGPTVIHQLENVTIAADDNLIDFRFPIQHVIRPHQDFRGFAGRVASGSIRVDEPVLSLPSWRSTKIKEIITFDGRQEEAKAGDSIVLTLADEQDISRGDMIVRKNNVPLSYLHFEATICWMDNAQPLRQNSSYKIQHTTRLVRGYVRNLCYRLDVNTLHRQQADTLFQNEIGRVEIETTQPLFFDPYRQNKSTGSFILIDEATNMTVAAGMIRGVSTMAKSDRAKNSAEANHIRWENLPVTQKMREARYGHKAHCLWLTGLSGSGKSTIAKILSQKLHENNKQVYIIDGDNIRHGLNSDLGFSLPDRVENIRRIGYVARLLYDAGFIVICSFISPRQKMRDDVRNLFPKNGFSEIFIKCDLSVCETRDPKGLYQKARHGEIKNFTGISDPYEAPKFPELVLQTNRDDLDTLLEQLDEYLNTVLHPSLPDHPL